MMKRQQAIGNRQQKIKLGVGLLITVFCFLFASPASAHLLKSDGSIGVLLHLDPDDDPYVGQPANFFFEIKDKNNKFAPANCVCKISIENNGTQVFSEDLFVSGSDNDINSAVFSYTFLEKGIYNVLVAGAPKTDASFQAFNVKFDVRISRESGVTNNQSSSVLIIGGFVVLAFIIGGVLYFRKKE